MATVHYSDLEPQGGDARLVEWTKILLKLQQNSGANPANDPEGGEAMRTIVAKVLKAKQGV